MRSRIHWLLFAGAAALLACAPITRGDPAVLPAATPYATAPLPPSTKGAQATPNVPARGGTLTVRFLDVGQGDAALVTTDDHHALLIDAGPPEGATHLARALDALGSTLLDAVLLSHAHADHLGGFGDEARRLPFSTWVESGFSQHAGQAYSRTRATLDARHIPVQVARRGDHFVLGAHSEVNVLLPREPFFHGTRSDVNANSVVVRIDHHALIGDARFLFLGDAEEPTEKRLLEDPGSLRADVLKVAHHGSSHASTDPLISAVAPKLAVISCGAGNDYGHPHASTLARLEAHHATIARTDVEGDITVTSDERGVSWMTARPGDAEAMHMPGVQKHGAEAP